MAFQFTVPNRTIMGNGALLQAKELFRTYGSKALIVTGKIVTKTGLVKKLTDLLDETGVTYDIFNEITGEPTDVMIQNGVTAYRQSKCNFIIAIGGGSPLDSAKAIAAMAVLPGGISDYLGKEISGSLPPLVLIPTTAGTGSETTKFTVITDSKKDIKMLLKGEALLPKLAIIDPELTLSAPKSITAATGMDALTHAVESYTSRKANPLTDLYALEAIKRIFTYLPRVYADGQDVEAREQMSIAAYYAGVCINNASVTIVHGMSRPIGALFHVPHGISNAMLITECLSYVMSGTYERFGNIAKAIGAAKEDVSDQEASDAFIQALKKLCHTVEIPTLEQFGIKEKDFEAVMDKMATDALASGSPDNTIKKITKNDILTIYKKLW